MFGTRRLSGFSSENTGRIDADAKKTLTRMNVANLCSKVPSKLEGAALPPMDDSRIFGSPSERWLGPVRFGPRFSIGGRSAPVNAPGTQSYIVRERMEYHGTQAKAAAKRIGFYLGPLRAKIALSERGWPERAG